MTVTIARSAQSRSEHRFPQMDLRAILPLLLLFSSGADFQTCGGNFSCVSVTQCDVDVSEEILYPCESDKVDTVCCPVATNAVVSRTSSFPEECGYFGNDDRITGGQNAAIAQFPWMALLGYKTDFMDIIQFLCGGSLITPTYVLTAAHCTNLASFALSVVRLGEWNLASENDCQNMTGAVICAQPPVDAQIINVMPHPKYNNVSLINDIALLKLKTAVTFTDFIQPICLPFDMKLSDDAFYKKRLIVSGWGKTTSESLGGSDILQYTHVTVWPKNECNNVVPPEARPIRDRQICANGKNQADSCKGDSGGPIFNATVIDATVKYHQYGIVSFASARICGNSDLPTIYTRIDPFLRWIIANAK